MFEVQFKKFADITSEKFDILWPSSESTPPTEANIRTIFTEIYAETYYCFSEVPTTVGLIDLVLVDRSQNEIVYCEFKSSFTNSINNILSDIERLDTLSIENRPYYLKNTSPSEVWKVIFQWSENESEVDKNKAILSETYPRTFQKDIIECEDATLFCLFSAWQRNYSK